MMANNKIARIIPVALILIIAAVTIAAFVSLLRFIFFPSSSPKTTKSNLEISREALLDVAVDRSVVLTVRGPIVADESFRSYQIKVSSSGRSLTVYKGYLEQPIKIVSFANNSQAYEQFVYALDKANMVLGTALSGDKNDLRGICATGNIYDYQTLKADKTQKDLWTSTCSGSRGSLNANFAQLNNLFIAQIPDSRSIINEIW